MGYIQPDYTPDPGQDVPDGTYKVEVKGVEEKRSKYKPDGTGEQPMLRVTFKIFGKDATFADYMMLGGKGRFTTYDKLVALGVHTKGSKEKIDPFRLIGQRAYAALVGEEYEGQKRPKINTRAEGSMGGLWPESAPPPDVAESKAADEFFGTDDKPVDPDSVPF